jgi:glycosyltransferase involved in cell wall biosynthesis
MADDAQTGLAAASGLSIVIPAYNEERRLPRTLDEIARYRAHLARPLEILVCDDGSEDGTRALVEVRSREAPFLRLISRPHHGKGAAVRAGMLAASMPFVMLCDADLSMPIEDLDRFIAALEAGADLAVGSREGPGAKRYGEPARRHLMGRIFNLLVKLLVIRGLDDTQCGFKGFLRGAAHDLFTRQQMDGFSFDAEILFLARKRGYSMKVVGIDWYFNDDSRVSAVSDTLKMTVDLMRIRLNDLRGLYRKASPVPDSSADVPST